MARFDSLAGWLQWQEGFHPRSIDLGLERAESVFNALNPEGIKPTTIIVAGTNGKGSCITFLEAIYRAQGYRVGAYTSPHILSYNERIRIDGIPVDDELICQAFERIDSVRNDTSLSYFEFGTLAALDIFWQSDLDIQLLEVGLGGRLDAINIIDSDVSLITSICIDHVDWLGETREAIGYEKAGVFRTGVPVIIGDDNPPKSMLQQAEIKKSPVLLINQAFDFERQQSGWDWHYEGKNKQQYLSLPQPGIKGEHQYANAASVLATVTILANKLPVTERAIRQGLEDASLPGRFQLIEGEVPVLLDVAHNPQAVRSLLAYLNENFADTRIHAVFSMMKDKDIKGVIDIIAPAIDYWFISPLSYSRAADDKKLKKCFQQCALNNTHFGFKNFSEAYGAAEEKSKKGDLIVVFGSFFLVSEYLANATNN